MKCPFCACEETRVIDSRMGKEGNNIRRRRECVACVRRFTTYERVEEILPMVVKKDGRREPFDRSKIIAGITRACEKRPIPIETIEKLVDKLEMQMQETSEREIQAAFIGEAVMKALHDLDEIAYVRFASVYRQFKDINEFMRELTDILGSQNQNLPSLKK
ncbi:MAG: transcriptional regulator NrdR [Desulfuromonadaceae bacterium]|nr:transcriptional regulator NrdR [Desulfuromonadaceae bacterium]